MSNRAAEANDEQTGGQRRHDIGKRGGRVGQVHAQGGDQSRVAQGLAEGGKAADPPQRTKSLMPQDVQGAVAVRAVEQGKSNHANGRETGADDQRIRQHHRQVFAQRRRQRIAHVHGNHQRHQPRPQLAQGKPQHVHRLGVLRQLFAQAKAQAHPVADPNQQRGQQAPDHDDQRKGKNDRQPLTGRQHQRFEFVLCLINLPCPARGWAVIAQKLFFEVGEGAADQPEHADLGFGLRLFGGVAQLLQVGQQLAALLVVLQVFDHFVQRLTQRLGGLGLGFIRAEQAGQADSVRRRDGEQRQHANEH